MVSLNVHVANEKPTSLLSFRLAIFLILLASPVWGDGTLKRDDANSIDQLIARISQSVSKKRVLHFTETKFINSLNLELTSKGTYSYRPPDRLEKITLSPVWERVLVDRENVSIETKEESREIPLRQVPPLQTIIESFLGILGGKPDTLRKNFAVSLSGSKDNWRLLLRPIDQKADQPIEKIAFFGDKNIISNVEISEMNGDRIFISLDYQ